ncbi:pyridoxamine 5'-phosphate oxidase family protein [Mycolicibacterium anyangense]
MAHRIVWASVATVDSGGRPRSRVLHPIWEWDGEQLQGWIATVPTPLKRAHVQANPYASITYWAPNHDTCTAECNVQWAFDDDVRAAIWEKFKNAPAPVGYDPAIIPQWSGGPTSEAFAVLRLQPWRLRVMPGTVMTAGSGELLSWRA